MAQSALSLVLGICQNKLTENGLAAGTLNSYCQALNELATCLDAIVEKTAALAEKKPLGDNTHVTLLCEEDTCYDDLRVQSSRVEEGRLTDCCFGRLGFGITSNGILEGGKEPMPRS